MPIGEINILVLSDLHFKTPMHDPVSASYIKWKSALESFLAGITTLLREKPEWRPSFIVLTGDIAFSGKTEEYEVAKLWLRDLLLMLDLNVQNMVICAGNHDLDRARIQGLIAPESRVEVDRILNINNFDTLLAPGQFNAYSQFCEQMGIPRLLFGNRPNYLIGCLPFNSIQFMVINSSWFHYRDDSRNKLWLGRNLLELLFAGRKTRRYNSLADPIIITLMHHPENWLHDAELNPDRNINNIFYQIAASSHIILTGHEHQKIVYPPDRKYARSWLFRSGAIYGEEDYWNNALILKINTERRYIQYLTVDYDPGLNQWNPSSNPEEHYSLLIDLPQNSLLINNNCKDLILIYRLIRNQDLFGIIYNTAKMLFDCFREVVKFDYNRSMDLMGGIMQGIIHVERFNIDIGKFLALWLYLYTFDLYSSYQIPVNGLKTQINMARIEQFGERRLDSLDEPLKRSALDLISQRNGRIQMDRLVKDHLTTNQLRMLFNKYPDLEKSPVPLTLLTKQLHQTPRFANFYTYLPDRNLDNFKLTDLGSPFENITFKEILIVDGDIDSILRVLEVLGIIDFINHSFYRKDSTLRERFFSSRESLFLNLCCVHHVSCNYQK